MLSLQLRSAATDGDVAKLTRLLRNVNPRERDEENSTPLHYAAWGGATALWADLIAAKADVNAVDDNGRTPLHLAAGYGRYDVTELLLARGAAVNVADKVGFTPLHQAAEGQWGVTGWEGTGGKASRHADVVRLLLASGANAALVDSFQRTPLDVAQNHEIRQILNAAQTEHIVRSGLVVGARDLTPTGGTADGGLASSGSTLGPIPPEHWDVAAVGRWLQSVGLGAYAAVFAEKGITGRYMLTRMTEEKAAKLIADEFHRDNLMDAISDLKQQQQQQQQQQGSRSADATTNVAVRIASATDAPRHTMPLRSMPTGVRATLTLDNKSTRDVRVLLIDERGDAQLKRILSPYQTTVEDAIEGQVYQLVDDREGWHLGWVRQLAVPMIVSVPDQRTPGEQTPRESMDAPPAYAELGGTLGAGAPWPPPERAGWSEKR